MTASSRTTIPSAVRVDAASPAPWLTQGDVSVVHLGQSALVLADRRGHIVVGSHAFGLAPGGIALSGADFARMRSELAAGRTGIAHWRPGVVEPVDLRMRPVDVDPGACAQLGSTLDHPQHAGALDPRRQRSSAPALSRAALAGEPPDGPLQRLVGAGPGSTPAGDDVVVGVLAGLLATGQEAAAEAVGRAVLRLLDRTTSASRLYLSAAADGRFAERVHVLVGGLRDVHAAGAAARAASGWGATSGLDLLAGILAAASLGASAPASAPALARRIA